MLFEGSKANISNVTIEYKGMEGWNCPYSYELRGSLAFRRYIAAVIGVAKEIKQHKFNLGA